MQFEQESLIGSIMQLYITSELTINIECINKISFFTQLNIKSSYSPTIQAQNMTTTTSANHHQMTRRFTVFKYQQPSRYQISTINAHTITSLHSLFSANTLILLTTRNKFCGMWYLLYSRLQLKVTISSQ